MGAGVSQKTLRDYQYRNLKKVQRELAAHDIPCAYRNLELVGQGFVVYFAMIGPASNGERFLYLVLRFNPQNQPSAAKKSDGDINYTNFHTRTIPEHSLGGWDAGVKRVIQHLHS